MTQLSINCDQGMREQSYQITNIFHICRVQTEGRRVHQNNYKVPEVSKIYEEITNCQS